MCYFMLSPELMGLTQLLRAKEQARICDILFYWEMKVYAV